MSNSKVFFFFSGKKFIAISKMFCLDFGLDNFFFKKNQEILKNDY